MSKAQPTPRTDAIMDQLTNLFGNYAKGKIYIEDVQVGLVFALAELRGLESENAKLREAKQAAEALLPFATSWHRSAKQDAAVARWERACKALAGEQPS